MIIVTTQKIGTVDASSMYTLIISVMQRYYNRILEIPDIGDQQDCIIELVNTDLKAKYGFSEGELEIICGGLKWEACVEPMWTTWLMGKDTEKTEIEV